MKFIIYLILINITTILFFIQDNLREKNKIIIILIQIDFIYTYYTEIK